MPSVQSHKTPYSLRFLLPSVFKLLASFMRIMPMVTAASERMVKDISPKEIMVKHQL